MAASGVDINSGSAADVQANTATIGALDEATIRNNAAREAFGYTTQATDYLTRARFARTAASNAALGVEGDEASTLLTGVGKTYGLYRTLSDGGRKRTALRGTTLNSSGQSPDDGQ
jgi:hypothetical protein